MIRPFSIYNNEFFSVFIQKESNHPMLLLFIRRFLFVCTALLETKKDKNKKLFLNIEIEI